MGLLSILDHSSRALQTASHGVSVASNNVSNASTPGYAREILSVAAKGSSRNRGLLLGQGVTAETVLSSYDSYSQASVFGRLGSHAFDEGRSTAFRSIETTFVDGDAGGLSTALDGLFQAFSALESSPEEPAARQAVLAAGGLLAQLMNRAAEDLSQRQVDADAQVGSRVSSVNTLASQVASLNAQIVELEAGGQGAHDLRARRTAALEDLSQLGRVTVQEKGDGSATVLFANHSLVVGGNARSLSVVNDPATGFNQVHVEMGGSSADITATLGSGTLGAAVQMRDVAITGLQAQLDELAFGVASEVNALHSTGFGLDGVTGRDFFAAPAAVAGAAAALSMDAAVATDPDAVAAASTAAGVPGDNSVATALAALAGGLTMSSGSQTFTQYWGGVISSLGHDASAAYASADRAGLELNAALDMRDSVSGVSLEEEALDLLRFQDAYKAAARVMQTAGEMLDELLNLVG